MTGEFKDIEGEKIGSVQLFEDLEVDYKKGGRSQEFISNFTFMLDRSQGRIDSVAEM